MRRKKKIKAEGKEGGEEEEEGERDTITKCFTFIFY